MLLSVVHQCPPVLSQKLLGIAAPGDEKSAVVEQRHAAPLVLIAEWEAGKFGELGSILNE